MYSLIINNHKDHYSCHLKLKSCANLNYCFLSQTSKRAKNSQSKRAQKKGINSNDEEGDGELNAHSSSTYSSEDDSNESQEINGGRRASNSKKSASTSQNGKPRAGRGSATDPQSLYARVTTN